jgi:hypothetical protein
MKFSNDLSNVQKAIEHKKDEVDSKLTELVKPVKCWKPESPADPLEGMAWYQKVWAKIFEPWKMRRFVS